MRINTNDDLDRVFVWLSKNEVLSERVMATLSTRYKGKVIIVHSGNSDVKSSTLELLRLN